MTTEQGNKLIAEFMGWKFNGAGWVHPDYTDHGTQTEMMEGLFANYRSWDWLMSVVEKMSTIHYGWKDMETPYDDCAYPRTFGMLNEEGKPMVRFNCSQVITADTLIEATWLAVVQFIQWYNTQKH